MHELSLVADLVAECERRAAGRPVILVHVRHAATLPEDTVREVFALLTPQGPLARATLLTTAIPVTLHCPSCGRRSALGPDHLVGHLAVCPRCGEVASPEPVAELELVDVVCPVGPSPPA